MSATNDTYSKIIGRVAMVTKMCKRFPVSKYDLHRLTYVHESYIQFYRNVPETAVHV